MLRKPVLVKTSPSLPPTVYKNHNLILPLRCEHSFYVSYASRLELEKFLLLKCLNKNYVLHCKTKQHSCRKKEINISVYVGKQFKN